MRGMQNRQNKMPQLKKANFILRQRKAAKNAKKLHKGIGG